MNKILDRLIVNRDDKTRHNYDDILVKTLDEIIDVLEDFEERLSKFEWIVGIAKSYYERIEKEKQLYE